MALEFELDLTGDTDETLDSGGTVPEGFYAVTLEDVYDDTKHEDLTAFEFKITAGPFVNKKLWWRVGDPRMADDAAKEKRAWDRIKSAAKRLGLIVDGEAGKVANKPINFADAIGWTGVVEVKRDKNNYVGIDYLGVYPAGHADLGKKKGFPAELGAYLPKDGGEPLPKGGKKAGVSGGGSNGATLVAGGGASDGRRPRRGDVDLSQV